MGINTTNPPAGAPEMIVLGSGSGTTPANDATWEDVGNFTVPGPLGNNMVWLFFYGLRTTGAGVAQNIALNNAVGDSADAGYTATAGANQQMVVTFRRSGSTTNCVNTFCKPDLGVFGGSQSSSTFNFSADEVVYLKAKSANTNIHTYSWIAYMIKKK